MGVAFNQGHPVGANELIVSDTGERGLDEAFNKCAARASATNPYIVRLLPQTYELTAVRTIPSHTTIVGAGRNATIINRATSLSNSVSSAYDPVLNAASTTNARLHHLTVRHSGTDESTGAPAKGPTALTANDATGLILDSVTLDAQYATLYKGDTTAPTDFKNPTLTMQNCQVLNGGFDGIKVEKTSTLLLGTSVQTILESTSPIVGGQDCIAVTAGWLRMAGCDVRMIVRRTLTNSGTGSACLMLLPSGSNDATVWIDGCTMLYDISGGDINQSGARISALDLRLGTLTSGDAILYASNSQFHYKTGTVTSAAQIAGLIMGQTGDNALRGQAFLNNVELRDIGGSGGTNRSDVLINMTNVGGAKVSKSVKVSNCRIAGYKYVPVTTPTLTHANYMVTEAGPNYQIGSSTFASAATASGTLPFTYPSQSSGVTDYYVALEPSANENFWVTSKTNSGFTLNSSNATSAATVNWTVRR